MKSINTINIAIILANIEKIPYICKKKSRNHLSKSFWGVAKTYNIVNETQQTNR